MNRWGPVLWACAAVLAVAARAQAQGVPAEPPRADASAPYQDQLIDGGKLPVDDGQGAGARRYDDSGWPRFFKLEMQLGSTRIGNETTTVRGVSVQAQIDTPQYGALSADIAYRAPPVTGVYTLRQIGMPFDGGWRANNVLGLFSPLTPEMMRNQPRFILPTTLLNGAGTEWSNEGRNLSLSFSSGQPGAFEGAQLPRFRSLDGTLSQFGAQAGSGNWGVALAGIVARGVASSFDLSTLADRNTWALALRRGTESTTLQVNALSSASTGDITRRGFWADLASREGPYTHTFGAFQFDPNLYWGNTPITSDLAGFYYRYNFRNRQWSIDGGVEALHSPSSTLPDGAFASGSVRYQYSRELSWGGGGAVRRFGQAAWSAFAFTERNADIGSTRLQADVAHDGPAADSYRVTIDQAWAVTAGRRLSTTLALDRQRTPYDQSDSVSVALLAGADLRSNLSLDASLLARKTVAGTVAESLSANASLTWRINPRWSMLATYYENRGKAQLFPVLDPLSTLSPVVSLPGERSAFLVLRYEDRAGLPSAPLGGKLGDAAGSVAGTVYLDANENGQRDANELPAPNVTVLLDGRFAVRTDSQGRFDFPLVAAGKHTLTLVPDNLPLPWAMSDGGSRQIVVNSRDTARVDFGATRLK